MKSKFDKAGMIAMPIIFFLLSIPGMYAYYFLDWRNDTLLSSASQGRAIPEFQEDSKILENRIILRKGKGIVVNSSKLVYKGLKGDMIHMDVYLLEFDPDTAYPRHFSEAQGRGGIRLGDSMLQLVKVNKKMLLLKIITLYES